MGSVDSGDYSSLADDSNIDLAALESDSDYYSSSSQSISGSLSSSSTDYALQRRNNPQNFQPIVAPDNLVASETYSTPDNCSKLPKVSRSTTNKSNYNNGKTASKIPSISKTYSGKSVEASHKSSNSWGEMVASPSKFNETSSQSFLNSGYKVNTNTSSDFHNNNRSETVDRDNSYGDDSYSFDYMSNVKSKPGDQLKTTWAMPMQNERQYKDLQIIDEVSKLQNLSFFSKDYVDNLENLKMSQLELLIDMVKLTDNSFNEFFTIWNNFEPRHKTSKGESRNGNPLLSSLSSERSSSKTSYDIDSNESENGIDEKINEEVKDANDERSSNVEDIEKNINDNDGAEVGMTWFDINNSEGFKLMEKRKENILLDLDKINESIDQIDSLTKSMWTSM